ncbi:hypothetical protein HELRODRAFT_182313 [Helobdella robusta]|uniref:Uncharacterized protein n=1 Tax=Helobdella robusta TaxID=6412 RepID=T1FI17_HELRO|nr:hypothetical protein HELRODRAFT_182313 [Helobdella robusta]ESN91062.1 hypothetical protein HELRODRAFT_182313 [Helobdella robusta]
MLLYTESFHKVGLKIFLQKDVFPTIFDKPVEKPSASAVKLLCMFDRQCTGTIKEDSEFKILKEQFQHIFEEAILELEFLNRNTVSTMIDNAVAYIAGWVVRKVTQMIDCNQCWLALVEKKDPKEPSTSKDLYISNTSVLASNDRQVIAIP